MTKLEEESKKDIAKRLMMSNKKLWNSLLKEKQISVVNKYYDVFSIESMGIQGVLERNADLRKQMGFLFMGTLLGILGGMLSSVLIEIIPENIIFKVSIIVGFFVFLYFLFQNINKFSAENLGEDMVLEHLLKMID